MPSVSSHPRLASLSRSKLRFEPLFFSSEQCQPLSSLSQDYEDKVLETQVTQAFRQFGKVFVKIKRDKNQMPYGFCQFTVRLVLGGFDYESSTYSI